MVAFIGSFVISLICLGVVVGYSKKRPADAPLTWGEAMLAAAFVFFALFWSFGVVPHTWFNWSANELHWASNKILAAPHGAGITLPFVVTKADIADIVMVAIYGFMLTNAVIGWKIWQGRGTEPDGKVPARSAFGRPVFRRGQPVK
jgi:putative effector of murein hydrolase LrgA (UPF0299 family)